MGAVAAASIVLPTAVLFLLIFQCAIAQSTGTPPPDSGDEDADQCVPAIANTCFADVAKDYGCLMASRQRYGNSSASCVGRDVADFCVSLDDALNCTSDIIDGDCSASTGRVVFDGWLAGLRSARRALCSGSPSRLETLAKATGACANSQLRFVPCMERAVGVSHVTDMLRVRLDVAECRKILEAAVECSKTSPVCTFVASSVDVMSDAVTAFLIESPCRGGAWWMAPPAKQQMVALSSGATAAIALLVCVALALGAALAFFTHRTSCFRIPLSRRS